MENDKLVWLSDVIETVENQCSDGNMWGNENLTLIDASKTIDELSDLPAVDAVEEKQGFWKAAGTRHPKPGNQRYRKQDHWTIYKCSNCGATNGRNRSDPYCRHCGARMLVDNCRYCYNGARMDGEEEHNEAD